MEKSNPGQSDKAEEFSRPEETPEEIGYIHLGLSCSLDKDETFDVEEY